ncbi:MAG: hypothetical protein J0J06_08335 [Sphingomonas sp.]|nr:hypothetical protein [Sphingomonas sp.]
MSCYAAFMTWGKRFATAALAAGLASGAAIAGGQFAALTGLQRGDWHFKEIGAVNTRIVCAADPFRLIQFNHPGPPCTRFAIVDAANQVTIQYNCGPRGYGKTTVTVTQPGQIRLDTQGIAPDGRPFDSSYEGQFAGPCAPPAR